MNQLTAERLRTVLSYDAETGVFTRLIPVRGARVGDVAGSIHKGTGYSRISVDCRVHLAHRLAWLWMTGNWPENQIDHRNCKRSDNRFSNLRDASHSVNQQNRRCARKDSGTGYLGVSAGHGGYVAQIGIGGRVHKLGTFPAPEAAHAAYLEAKRQMHSGCTI